MERRSFETPLGEIWLWARPEAYGEAKPAVLVIGGAFQAERSAFFQLPDLVPAASVFLAHLPGNNCPEVTAPTVGAYAWAYDKVVSTVLKDRPTVVCGASVGALVALAMTAEPIRRLFLLDPPLVTSKLWLLVPVYRKKMAERPGGWEQRFIEGVFGIYPDRVEERDYRPLVTRLSVASIALIGGLPLLPPRPFDEIPSLVDEPERELLRSHPLVRAVVAPGVGHTLDMHAIVRGLRLLVSEAAGG
jgi:pimeloyl-ACP methyl ester carboxylesterase